MRVCLSLSEVFVVLQLWPLVSLLNYKYVPLKLRVLVMQAIAFFW